MADGRIGVQRLSFILEVIPQCGSCFVTRRAILKPLVLLIMSSPFKFHYAYSGAASESQAQPPKGPKTGKQEGREEKVWFDKSALL